MKKLGPIIGTASELGLTMGLSAAGLVIIGLVAGRWIDARLGTSPVATILFLVGGAVAAQISLYRLALSSHQQLSTSQRLQAHKLALPALTLGLRLLLLMIGPGLVGLLVGLWLQRFPGVPAWTMIALVLLGFSIGLYGVIRLLKRQAEGQKG